MEQETAEKSKFRRVGRFESLGETLGGWVAAGPLRGWLRAAYRGMLHLRSLGRGIRCELPGGEGVRVLPAYRLASWNLAEYRAFKAATYAGQVVLDIGANVGTYSVLFGQWVGPSGQVHAFEPAPEAFDALRRHIKMNGQQTVVRAIPEAVSDKPGVVGFLADNFQGTNRIASSSESTFDAPGSTEVLATTIDDYCARHGLQPDVIKIDIEGFELAAIRGARKTIRAGCGKLALFVEMHPTTWKVLGISREDILSELDSQGLVAEPLIDTGESGEVEGVCMRLVPKP